jgi:hypothetical protein
MIGEVMHLTASEIEAWLTNDDLQAGDTLECIFVGVGSVTKTRIFDVTLKRERNMIGESK